jgi:hypothetical protein
MRNTQLLPCVLLAAVTGSLLSCSKSPVEYRLTAQQLAWQGYHVGEELRFGRAQDATVRTYRVTDVRDVMEQQYRSATLGLPGGPPETRCQQLGVAVQRTDTTAPAFPALLLKLYYDEASGGTADLQADAEWETFYYASLPLDSVNKGAAFDTLRYPGTELLASFTAGSSTYSQVLHLTNRFPLGTPVNGQRPVREIYYARGKGVVAFQADGSGLWYRLP